MKTINNKIQEALVSFPVAKQLKEAGFEVKCFYKYNKDSKLEEPYLENGSSTDVEFRVDLTDLLENWNNKHISREMYSAPTPYGVSIPDLKSQTTQ